MKKDPYAVLGVSPSATLDDIKKAYKTKARQFHPDKNKDDPEATARFKEVQEAFELLRDKRKRTQYDQFGHMDERQGGSADDFFRDIFQGFNNARGAAASGSFTAKGFAPRVTTSFDINCTLPELYTGTTKRIKLRRTSTTLNRPSETILELKIQPGFGSGTRVVFKGEGDEIGSTGAAQDVQFNIREVPYPGVVRQGLNLFIKLQVTLVEALCGGSFEVDVLGVKQVKVVMDGDSSIRPGQRHIVQGEGMPNMKLGRPAGDLVVEFDILFPTKLTTEQRTKLKEVLGEVQPSSSAFSSPSTNGEAKL